MAAHPCVWEWLNSPDFVMTTDRGLGILSAIKEKLPRCIPRLCALHLLDNLPKVVGSLGEEYRSLYWSLVKDKYKGNFDTVMEQLLKSQPQIAQYLGNIPAALWADHAFPGSTLGRCTSSSAERAINLIGVDFRSNGPVYGLKQLLRRFCERIFNQTCEAQERKKTVGIPLVCSLSVCAPVKYR